MHLHNSATHLLGDALANLFELVRGEDLVPKAATQLVETDRKLFTEELEVLRAHLNFSSVQRGFLQVRIFSEITQRKFG